MIKLQNLTPEVYYKQSRDFQLIGRLYDIVLNYVKTNTANLYNLPIGPNMNEQLLNLLALTLGFKPKKHYNSKQLLAICSVLPEIMKHKGSIQAILTAVNALLAAEEINQPLDYTLIAKESIVLYVSQQLTDLSLLTDLFDYILPAGISYQLIKENQIIKKITTNLSFEDTVIVTPVTPEQSTTAINNIRYSVVSTEDKEEKEYHLIDERNSLTNNIGIITKPTTQGGDSDETQQDE